MSIVVVSAIHGNAWALDALQDGRLAGNVGTKEFDSVLLAKPFKVV